MYLSHPLWFIREAMDWNGVHFWAKTTKDGQPGISVRDHCLKVGCMAEVLFIGIMY